MNRFEIEIHVTPRPGLLDPEGKAIEHALHSLDYAGVHEVRAGKAIYFDLDAPSASEAEAAADEMCRKLLANPVTEEYEVIVSEAPAEAPAP